MCALRVGVIALEDAQTEKLCDALIQCQVDICYRLTPSDILNSHVEASSLDVWLLNIEDDDWNDQVDDLMDNSVAPVFFNEPSAIDHQQHVKFWCEKLIEKLRSMVELDEAEKKELKSPVQKNEPVSLDESIITHRQPPHSEQRQASEQQQTSVSPDNVVPRDKKPSQLESTLKVWVLGASLGGPAAVKRFIHHLPCDLDVIFILAQHIDQNFLPSLSKILESDEGIQSILIEASHLMKPGELIINPIDKRLVFTPAGIIAKSDQAWSSDYSPCISDVIVDVANTFTLSGTIIFSGMGDDAVEGCRYSKTLDRPVWCQSADTCASATMPDAVRDANLADYSGSPEELADKLVLYLLQQKRRVSDS